METLNLGPNGGIIYCLEYLEQNLDWLHDKIQQLGNKYLLIDFPGQVLCASLSYRSYWHRPCT